MKLLYTTLICFFLNICVFAHWTTRGPYGGNVTCMVQADTLVFAGTNAGGIFRTTNAAATSWRYANYTGLTDPDIRSLTYNGRHVLAATAGGIFRSDNIGDSWTVANSGLGNMDIQSISAEGAIVIAGTNGDGVYVSIDSGLTWLSRSNGIPDLDIRTVLIDGINIFAGTATSGIYYSNDNGVLWTQMNGGLTQMKINSIVAMNGNYYAATGAGAFVSQGLGAWNSIPGHADEIFSLHASNGFIYAATADGVYITPESNPTWTPDNNNAMHKVNCVLDFNGKLLSGTEAQGVLSKGSTGWNRLNTGLNNLKTSALYNDNLLVIAATNKGLYVSKDLAANYTPANTGLTDSTNITSVCFAGSDLYISTKTAGVWMSPDTGTTWMQVSPGLGSNDIRQLAASSSMMIATDASGGVYYSSLPVSSWQTATTTFPLTITELIADDSEFFIATDNGVYRSADGQLWTSFNTGLVNMNVSSLALKNGYVFAGTVGGGVYRSVQTSDSWTAVNAGLPVMDITSMHSAGQWVLAGYKGGVHVSFDEGMNWHAPNVLIYIPEYADVTGISFSDVSTRVFVSTPDNSLYSNSVSELPIGIDEIVAEDVFTISPNPVTGGNLSVKKIKSEKYPAEKIIVTDLSGRVVRSYSENVQEIPVSGIAAGSYFITVLTGKASFSQLVQVQ